jgi:hypothetical protein
MGPGPAIGIDELWRRPPHDTVLIELACPTFAMHPSMVVGAQQRAVVEIRGTTVGPMSEMVGVAFERSAGTSGESAAAVAQDQSPALGWAEQPGRTAEVQRCGAAAHHCGQDLRVAGEPAHLIRRNPRSAIEQPSPDLAGKGVIVDGEDQLWSTSAVLTR